MTADGTTLLRYDNYTDAHGAQHHRHHHEDGIVALEYEGWQAHVRRFFNDMEETHDER